MCPDLHKAPVVRPLQLYYRALGSSKPTIKTRVWFVFILSYCGPGATSHSAHSCRNDHSVDRQRIALYQVQKLLPYGFTNSNIQVLPFGRSLYGGTLILLEMSPCFVHLELRLKDKCRASQRLFENNVPSALLEIMVVPLAYIHRVQMCTMLHRNLRSSAKIPELCHIILCAIPPGHNASLTRLMQSYR